ncbi:MAG: TonB-dependent receptor [Gammaproteobacteria bacterium]|nr:TonB-dependent receptor [Gammaproteobacteria bacterium]MDE0364959.1 TonB-dependent receptor [Gammaproteobacteria bacterium]
MITRSLQLVCAAAAATLFGPAGLTATQDTGVSGGAIEEIIVTAKKRAQSIQDVHISMNAFGPEDIKELGWTDITQLANQSPNLEIRYRWGNSMPVYTIRGVGMQSFQASDTPSVGLFIDEVFQTSMAVMGAHLFDIERLEVIKGPQGDVFGRNTNGGAVSYFTRKPSREANGYARASYGRWDRSEVQAAVGGPLGETVSGRISLMSVQQGDGWVYNRTTGNGVGEVDILSARAQLLWEPADDWSVNVKVFGSRDRSQPVYFQHVGYRDINNFGPGGDLCQAFLEDRLDPATCVDFNGYSDTDGDPYAGDYTEDPTTVINEDETLKNDNFGGTLTIEKDFGNMSLLSVTSYQEYDRWQPKESDGTPALYVDLLFTSEIWAFSQEVRLTSQYDGPFNWIVGANYGRDQVAELPGRIAYFDDLPVLPGRGELTYSQDRENIAAYGQFTVNFGEQWRLSAGGRVLRDDVTFTQDVTFAIPAWNLVLTNSLPTTRVNPDGSIEDLDGKLDDTAVTWRVALDYAPNDNLMVYGSVATGYKPGGFNAGFTLNSLQYLPFIHEKVMAMELGLKSSFANGRAIFNAAAFTYDYDQMQAATPRTHQGIVFNSLDNLAEADVEGFEADIHWRPVDALDIKLGFSLLDTRNNDPRSNFDGATGDSPRRLADSPKQTFSAAVSYEIPLANGAMIRLFGDYYYQGDHFKEVVNIIPLEVNQDQLNGRITYVSPGGNWDVAVWGRNITDEAWIADTLNGPASLGWGAIVYGAPRSFGATVNWRWGQ